MPRGGWYSVGVVLLFALLPFVYGNHALLFNMMMYLVLAQGINVLFGFTGYLPFGYVGFFGAGAYGASLAILLVHLPPVPALFVGAAVSVLVALLLAPLLRLSGAYFAIASLAASEVIYYIVSNPHLVSLTQGPYGISLAQVYNSGASYATMVVVLAMALAVVVYLRNSHMGLALQAIREEPISAGFTGINVVRERTRACCSVPHSPDLPEAPMPGTCRCSIRSRCSTSISVYLPLSSRFSAVSQRWSGRSWVPCCSMDCTTGSASRSPSTSSSYSGS